MSFLKSKKKNVIQFAAGPSAPSPPERGRGGAAWKKVWHLESILVEGFARVFDSASQRAWSRATSSSVRCVVALTHLRLQYKNHPFLLCHNGETFTTMLGQRKQTVAFSGSLGGEAGRFIVRRKYCVLIKLTNLLWEKMTIRLEPCTMLVIITQLIKLTKSGLWAANAQYVIS